MYYSLNSVLKGKDYKAVPFVAVVLLKRMDNVPLFLKTVLVSEMQAMLIFLNTFLKYLLMNQRKSDAFCKHQHV